MLIKLTQYDTGVSIYIDPKAIAFISYTAARKGYAPCGEEPPEYPAHTTVGIREASWLDPSKNSFRQFQVSESPDEVRKLMETVP